MKRKTLSLLLIIIMIFSQISFSFGDDELNGSVRINTNVPFIHVEAIYDGLTETVNADDQGTALLPDLYKYLIDNGFDADDAKKLIKLNLNYDGSTVSERHYLGGNTMYEGKTVEVTLDSGEAWDAVDVSLEEETAVVGFVYRVPLEKGIDDATPAHGITVTSGDNETITGDDGFFTFEEGSSFTIEETDDYAGVSSDDPMDMYIWDKFDADDEMYEVTPEWLGEDDTEFTLTCADGYTASIGDGFKSSLKISTKSLKKVVFKDELGHVSRPYDVKFKRDAVAPRIIDLDLAAEGVELTSHGVYGNSYATFTIAVTVEEKESGLKKVSLVGKDGEYTLIDAGTDEGKYTAVYRIDREEDVFKDTLKVVAEDKAGNKSEAKLIRDTEDESTLILENLPPEVEEIKIPAEGRNENGWYTINPSITVSGRDTDSGLKSIVVELNGRNIYERTYNKKVTTLESYTFKIPEEIISKAPEEYRIRAIFTDNAGSSNVKTRVIKIDDTIPELVVEGVEDGALVNTIGTVKVSVNENYPGLKGENVHIKVEYKDALDNTKDVFNENFSGKREGVIPRDVFELDGVYTITGTAKDAAGNESSINVTLTKDSEGPIITWKDEDIDDSVWHNKEISLPFSVYDITTDIKETEYYINNKEVTPQNRTITLTKEIYDEVKDSSNTFTFKIHSVDEAGNESELTRTLKVDMDAPVINVSGVSQGSVYSKSPDIKVTIDENHPYETFMYVLAPGSEEAEERAFEDSKEFTASDLNKEGVYSIRITSKDLAGNIAKEVALSFTVDKTAPEITSLGVDKTPNANGWYNDGLTYSYEIKETASGLKGVKAYVNGTEVETAGGKVLLTKDIINKVANDKGEYTIKIVAENNAGLTFDKEDTYKIDISNPKVTLSGITEGGIYKDIPTLNIKVDDKHMGDIAVAISRNGTASAETFKGNEASVSSFKEDGNYTVTVKATDLAGNVSSEAKISFTYDSTAPELTSKGTKEEPNSNHWFKDSVTFRFDVHDALSGLKGIKAYINDKEVETNSGEVVLTKALISELEKDSGEYVFKITAEDKAGNKSELTETVKADIVKPVVTLSNIREGAIYVSAPNLNIDVDDKHITDRGGVINLEMKRNGEKITIKSGYTHVASATINEFSEDGLYEVTVTATDAAGNVSDKKVITFTIDSTDPVINDMGVKEGSPNRDGWYNSPITYQYEVQDKTSGVRIVAVRVNGKSVESRNGEVAITKSLIEETINMSGTYTVEIEAQDNAGNTKLFDKTFRIDIVKPNLTLSGITNGENYVNVPRLEISSDEKHFSESEAYMAYEIIINGSSKGVKTNRSTNIMTVNEFDQDGRYTVRALAKDAAGNSADEKEISFVKDSTLPVIRTFSAASPANGNGWYSGPVSLDVLAEDATAGIRSVTATVNGESVPINDGRITITNDLINNLANASGTYSVVISVTDNSGNTVTDEKIVKIDTVAPQVSMSGIESGKVYKETPTLNIGSNDKFSSDPGHVMHVEITRDGERVSSEDYPGTGMITLNNFANDGNYTVKVTAKDAAGNTSNEQSVSFSKDASAPAISITGVTANEWNKENAVLTLTITERFYNTAEASVVLTREINGKNVKVPFDFSYTGIESRSSLNLTESGRYTITVNAKDEAGNVAEQKSVSFYVDVNPPTVNIRGLENNKIYGYDDLLSAQIQYDDEYLDNFTYSLIKGDTEWKNNIPISENNGTIVIESIPKQKANDGVYTLKVTATDKAGNKTEKEIEFIVVRFGSVFKIVQAPQEKYNQLITDDIIVEEINFSDIKDYEITVSRDSEINTIKNVRVTKKDDTTTYIIPKTGFTEEGIYRINIATKDSADNTSELSAQYEREIWFAIDKTPPVISYNGVKPGETYIGDSIRVYLDSTDSISPNSDISARVNGENAEVYSEDGFKYIVLHEGKNQNIEITAIDTAGNSATETINNVTVTTNKTTGLLNKPVLLGVIPGLGILALLGAVLLIKRRNKEEETGDDIDF